MFLIFERDMQAAASTVPAAFHHQADGSVRVEFVREPTSDERADFEAACDANGLRCSGEGDPRVCIQRPKWSAGELAMAIAEAATPNVVLLHIDGTETPIPMLREFPVEVDFLGDAVRVRTGCFDCGKPNATPQTRADLSPECDDCGDDTTLAQEEQAALAAVMAEHGFRLTMEHA